ncbi:MAG TPA: autotransporter domain-containing protein, partial [Rhizomicrobium sp.]|nr:autotransporter domain-containing protein [Rhizomicrobium sp.]
QIGDGGTKGFLPIGGPLNDDGILIFDRFDNTSYGGSLSGDGIVEQSGPGILTLSGNNNPNRGGSGKFQGLVEVLNGAVSISQNNTLNGAPIELNSGTALNTTGTDTYTSTLSLSGDSFLNVANGTTATWTGAIVDGTSPGTLKVTGGGTLVPTNAYRTIIGDFVDVSINPSLLWSPPSDINGNSYSGGTIVAGNSTILVAADGDLGAGELTLGDSGSGGTLKFNGQFNLSLSRAIFIDAGGGIIDTNGYDTTIAQTIGGAGGLTKVGTGALTLAGTNTYTGGTTVNGGTLIVNGAVGNVTVNVGGTLSGTGMVGATTINSGGTLAPGISGSGVIIPPNDGGGAGGATSSAGTISTTGAGATSTISFARLFPGPSNSQAFANGGALLVNGNLTLSPGSTYSVFVTSTGATSTAVGGSANLAGTVLVAPFGNVAFNQKIAVLTAAGGVDGAFSALDLSGSIGLLLKGELSYGPNSVYVTLVPTANGGMPRNVTSIIGAIDYALLNDNAFNTFAPLFNLSPGQLENALARMSGEAGVDASQGAFDLNASFLNTLTSAFGDSSFSGLFAAQGVGRTQLAYAGPADATPLSTASPFRVWSTTYGGWSNLDGDENGLGTHGFTSAQGGVAAGIDDRLSADAVVGGALGYGHSGWWAKDSMGSGAADAAQLGLYGDQRIDDVYLSLVAGYAHYWTTTTDSVNTGSANAYRGQYAADSEAVRGEVSRRIAVDDDIWLAPYLAGEGQWYETPAYSQSVLSGSPAFALSFAGKTQSDVTHDLGLEADWICVNDEDVKFDLNLKAGWLHQYEGQLSEQASFSAFANTEFTSFGTRGPRNAARLSLGGAQSISDALTLRLLFDSVLSGSEQSYNGLATLAYHL